MNVGALALDYDGTLATSGRVEDATWAALEALRCSGRRLLLVTGRELPELREVCPRLSRFDRVVAENGALLWRPEADEEVLLGAPPPPSFARALRARGVERLSEGRVVVATWRPWEREVLEVLRAQRLPHQVVFNKEAVMVLPPGVHKGSGVLAALAELGVEPAQAVGVGDAENDLPLLRACGWGVAVANAVPALKEAAHRVMHEARGAGVRALVEVLLKGESGASV